MARVGDPSINPYLWPWEIAGYDEYGRDRVKTLPPPMPSLYFWLGEAAYPQFKRITSVVADSSAGDVIGHWHRLLSDAEREMLAALERVVFA